VASKNKDLANNYLNEMNEWLRQQRDGNFYSFKGHGEGGPNGKDWCLEDIKTFGWSGSYCNTTDFIPGTIFIRGFNLDTYNEGGQTKVKANGYVKWDDAQGSHEVRSVTIYTNWQ
jgi:hypothetical protein